MQVLYSIFFFFTGCLFWFGILSATFVGPKLMIRKCGLICCDSMPVQVLKSIRLFPQVLLNDVHQCFLAKCFFNLFIKEVGILSMALKKDLKGTLNSLMETSFGKAGNGAVHVGIMKVTVKTTAIIPNVIMFGLCLAIFNWSSKPFLNYSSSVRKFHILKK